MGSHTFWYDGERQWEREFEELQWDGIQKLGVDGTELRTKVGLSESLCVGPF